MDLVSLVPNTARQKAWNLSFTLKYPTRGIAFHFPWGGIGDHLMCTAIFRTLAERNERNLWMVSNRTELFANNPDLSGVISEHPRNFTAMRALGWSVRSVAYTHRVEELDQDVIPERHLISSIAALAGVRGKLKLRPYVHLLPQERQWGEFAAGKLVIQSSGSASKGFMRNKEWFSDRYQAVVNTLRGEHSFIQVGAAKDPLLQGALDLRGKTTLRQTASILSRARLFIGQIGLLMHMARAVDCRSVIVYGGRELPSQSGYASNENLTSPEPCAPCWQWNRCDYDRKCLTGIGVDAVVSAVERALARPSSPLECEEDIIPDSWSGLPHFE